MAVPRTRLPLALAVSTALALTLTGCSASGSSNGSSGAASDAATDSAPPAAAEAGGSGGAKAPGSQQSQTQAGYAPATVVQQRVIRSAHVVVRVDGELAPAAAKVRAIAQGLGGTVASETTALADAGDPGTTTDGSDANARSGAGSPAASSTLPGIPAAAHPGQSLLVLRVPESSLGQALAQITGSAGVGKELSRSASAQDVTGDLADLQSRVATQRASVQRIRALLGKAGSLQDVVLLESEVTKREADLEALEARRAALADRADLATLTVDLRTAAAVVPGPEKKQNAFLQGLDSGWQALTASMTVILTVLGALLPLAIVLVLVGGPVLWVLRRRRRQAPPPAPAPSPGAGS